MSAEERRRRRGPTGAGQPVPAPGAQMNATDVGPAAKAAILVEALPYIRRFWGQVVVVKYGGNALAGAADNGGAGGLASFATDIVLMRSVGMRPLVVHGGGPQIGELMARLGKVPEFIDGLRVTDAETLDIARMVLVGKVNRDIVSAINIHAPLAVGVSGEDAGIISAEARHPAAGLRRRRHRRKPGSAQPAAGRGSDPRRRDHRQRPQRAGLQHQCRYRGGGRGRGGRGHQTGVPDRRRRDSPGPRRPGSHGCRRPRPTNWPTCWPMARSTAG